MYRNSGPDCPAPTTYDQAIFSSYLVHDETGKHHECLRLDATVPSIRRLLHTSLNTDTLQVAMACIFRHTWLAICSNVYLVALSTFSMPIPSDEQACSTVALSQPPEYLSRIQSHEQELQPQLAPCRYKCREHRHQSQLGS
jgi:hypothetical protein